MKPEDKEELAQQRREVVKAVRSRGKWFTVFNQVKRHIDKGKQVMWGQKSNRGAASWVGLNSSWRVACLLTSSAAFFSSKGRKMKRPSHLT